MKEKFEHILCHNPEITKRRTDKKCGIGKLRHFVTAHHLVVLRSAHEHGAAAMAIARGHWRLIFSSICDQRCCTLELWHGRIYPALAHVVVQCPSLLLPPSTVSYEYFGG